MLKRSVSATDLREETASILDTVQHHGKGVLVTRRGKVVATILPLDAVDLDAVMDAVAHEQAAGDESEIAQVDHLFPGRLGRAYEKLCRIE